MEDARFGSEAQREAALSSPGGLTVAPTGALFILQPMDNSVRVFGADGCARSMIGRPGEGPGEFRSLNYIGVRGDTLWVTDGVLQRVSFFTLDGRHIRTDRILTLTRDPFGPAVPEGFLRDGSAFGASQVSLSQMGAQLSRAPILRLTRAGQVRDTLAWISMNHIVGSAKMGAGVLSFQQPISDARLRASAPRAHRRSIGTASREHSFGLRSSRR